MDPNWSSPTQIDCSQVTLGTPMEIKTTGESTNSTMPEEDEDEGENSFWKKYQWYIIGMISIIVLCLSLGAAFVMKSKTN